LQSQTLLVLSRAHRLRGNLGQAISSLKTAARLIEKTRYNLSVAQIQISYFSEAQQIYRQLVTCYLKKYRTTGKTADLDTLFYYTQLTRGRTMHELAARRRSGQMAMSYDDEYLQRRTSLRSIQRRIRERPNLKNVLRTELEAARLALVTKRLRLSNNGALSDNKTNSEAQWLLPVVENLIKQNTGLLLYHLAGDTSFVFVIANHSAQIVGLDVKPDALHASVSELMSPFHGVKGDSVQFVGFRADIAHRLYETLIRPVELAYHSLPPNLLIVPDIEIMQLPFEMLLVGRQKKTEYTPLDEPEYARDFLLHRYTISYSPSLAFLQIPAQKFARAPRLLLFANPFSPQLTLASTTRSQRGWRFDALPYAEIEAKAIREKFGTQAKLFLRDKATKAKFFRMAGDYQIIHLATHAFADNTFDAFSGLVLAATCDSTDDGILMGYEIADMQLQAELVALSACETGRGRVVSGEGVLGLPRLFLGAGAKSVLMTRWLIDDEFSSRMLPKFYEFCLEQDFSKAEALAGAKRSLLREISQNAKNHYQHPFYWASYSLYGHPGKIRSANWQTLLIYLAAILFLCLFILLAGKRWFHRRKKA
jgi:CHAT domain-containing protein